MHNLILHHCVRNPVQSLLLMCIVSWSTVFFGSQCLAQERGEPGAAAAPYRELPVDESLRSKSKFQVNRILLAGRFADDQEKEVFDEFYKKYALARWSIVKNRSDLPNFRKELRNNLRMCGTGGRPPEVHDHLNELTLKYMSGFAGGNFHPATRVNAMLMIGELNEKESSTSSEPPVPLPAALMDHLLPTVLNTNQLDAVKVVALVGIARHGRLGAVDEQTALSQVAAAMVKLLTSPRPSGKVAEGDAWMRGQAAEILGMLTPMGGNSAVVNALGATIANKALPFSTRCSAAEALGKLNFRGAAGMRVAPILNALRELTLDACAAEAQIVERRRLKSRINAVKIAVTGIAKAPGAATAAAIQQPLTTILTVIEDRKLTPDEMMQKVNAEAAKLRGAPSKNP